MKFHRKIISKFISNYTKIKFINAFEFVSGENIVFKNKII